MDFGASRGRRFLSGEMLSVGVVGLGFGANHARVLAGLEVDRKAGALRGQLGAPQGLDVGHGQHRPRLYAGSPPRGEP